jgi:hypothetical protein
MRRNIKHVFVSGKVILKISHHASYHCSGQMHKQQSQRLALCEVKNIQPNLLGTFNFQSMKRVCLSPLACTIRIHFPFTHVLTQSAVSIDIIGE